MKPGPNDVKLTILITADELRELRRFTVYMTEAFGLDRRIEAYAGKRPSDDKRVAQGEPIFDNLYQYFRSNCDR